MDHALLALTKGLHSKVSVSDLPTLVKYRWHVSGATKKSYAATLNRDGKSMYLHRFLMADQLTEEMKFVDHINGDSLDNRRENLRVCSRVENNRNRKRPSGRYKGIVKRKDTGGNKWRAIVNIDGKQVYFGQYDTPEEAARAYDKAAKELFGEFANLNFE